MKKPTSKSLLKRGLSKLKAVAGTPGGALALTAALGGAVVLASVVKSNKAKRKKKKPSSVKKGAVSALEPEYLAEQAEAGNPVAVATVSALGLPSDTEESKEVKKQLFVTGARALERQRASGTYYDPEGVEQHVVPGEPIPMASETYEGEEYVRSQESGALRSPFEYPGHPGAEELESEPILESSELHVLGNGDLEAEDYVAGGANDLGSRESLLNAAFSALQADGNQIANVEFVDKVVGPDGKEAYGHIDYTVFPYRVRIDRKTPRGRQLVTLVHEMVHAISKLRKLGLTEIQVHALAIGILGDIIPVLEKHNVLERKHG